MNEHTKIVWNFIIDVLLLIFGISLIEIHLLLSCVSILIVTSISIIKFLYWKKNKNENNEKNERLINRPDIN